MHHEEAIATLKDAEALCRSDPEAGHCMADKVLVDWLRGLGYDDLVDAYESAARYFI